MNTDNIEDTKASSESTILVTKPIATATATAGTNVTSTATSSALAETSDFEEVNFEDLIQLNSVEVPESSKSAKCANIPKASTSRSSVEDEEIKSEVAKSSIQSAIENSKPAAQSIKIIPRPTNLVKTNSGQVIIVQNSSIGVNQAVRISNAGPSTSTMAKMIHTGAGGKPVGQSIQVIRMPDGSLVQIKPNKALNLTNLSNVSKITVPVSKTSESGNPERLIVKSSNGQKILLKQSSTGEKAVKILPAGSTLPKSSTVAVTTTTTSTSQQKGAQQKIIVTDSKGGVTKQIIVPQQLMKVTPKSQPGSSIQAIQLPGKTGVQYVRFLGNSPSSGGLIKGQIIQNIRSKDGSPTKVVLVQPSSSNKQGVTQNIIMQSKVTHQNNTNSDLINKPGTSAQSQIMGKQLSTVQSLKKVVTTSQPTVTTSSGQKIVTTLINSTASRTSSETTKPQQYKIIQRTSYPGKVTPIALTPSGGHHQLNSTAHQMIVQQKKDTNAKSAAEYKVRNLTAAVESSQKLYSILKPEPLDEEDLKPKLELVIPPVMKKEKRTPSPEAVTRRKHCNCTKSQCLKLYCDCFANGEFCQDCNCKECYNNLQYEEERQKAIRMCLERNPNAFKPKITKSHEQNDLRLHNKGCNCKRSGCLKNYCECYEAKIACSSNCKCFGCRNVEDRSELDPYEVSKIAQNFGRGISTKRSHAESVAPPTKSKGKSQTFSNTDYPTTSNKPAYNFITQDVVDATIQCMIAQADECKKMNADNPETERSILEELGRCLVEIIEFSIKNMDN